MFNLLFLFQHCVRINFTKNSRSSIVLLKKKKINYIDIANESEDKKEKNRLRLLQYLLLDVETMWKRNDFTRYF